MEESLNLNVSNRKIRKPLMERKRRARINKSLNELQQILTDSELTPKGTKLEKADILEMTVQYLNTLKQNNYTKEDKENLENLMLEQYLLGFEKCSREVGKYVADIPEVNLTSKNKLNSYLMTCLGNIKKQPLSHSLQKQNVDAVQTSWDSPQSCSFLLQQSKQFRILPSHLANGEMVFLLSSDLEKCEDLRKRDMWRPW